MEKLRQIKKIFFKQYINFCFKIWAHDEISSIFFAIVKFIAIIVCLWIITYFNLIIIT